MWLYETIRNRLLRLHVDPIDMDTEYCYLPVGDWEGIRCKELPKWLHALNVATWYPVDPLRHVVEWVVCTTGAIIILRMVLKRHAVVAQGGLRRHPLPLLYLAAALYHVYHYKFYMPLPERGWSTTPCHFGWIVRLFMHCVPVNEVTADMLRHALLCFSSLAALFILQPDGDVTDAVYDGIFTWSLIHHVLLITIPVWDVITGRIAVLPPPVIQDPGQPEKPQPSVLKYFMKWHLVSVACYVLMYGTVVTPISILSGVNWGWTLHFHATKVAEKMRLTGPNYRVWWFGHCNYLFMLFRLMWMILDYVLRGSGFSKFSRSQILKVQLERIKQYEEQQQQQQKTTTEAGVVADNGQSQNGNGHYKKNGTKLE